MSHDSIWTVTRDVFWREPGSRYRPSSIVGKDNDSRGVLMIWAGRMINGNTDHVRYSDKSTIQGRDPCTLYDFSTYHIDQISSLWTITHIHIELSW
ncbi:hypothetical protein TNCV_2663411 [Trichonephila clavipes]|nr:hypothetical protein TNCV_2663411 [Trichonephila clavipes]